MAKEHIPINVLAEIAARVLHLWGGELRTKSELRILLSRALNDGHPLFDSATFKMPSARSIDGAITLAGIEHQGNRFPESVLRTIADDLVANRGAGDTRMILQDMRSAIRDEDPLSDALSDERLANEIRAALKRRSSREKEAREKEAREKEAREKEKQAREKEAREKEKRALEKKRESWRYWGEFQKLAEFGKIRSDQIDALCELVENGFVKHRSWGVGKIRSVDTMFSKLKVDFPGKREHSMDLSFACKVLEPVPEDAAESLLEQPRFDQLNWRMLPAGQVDLMSLERLVQKWLQRSSKEYEDDYSRLQFLIARRPVKVFVGTDEFEGYFAFLFDSLKGAVMENPTHGNAIYVFHEDWEKLSKLPKSELFRHHSARFTRIVHSGAWKDRLLKFVS